MYESYFGLTEKPFSLNPDPDYLYLGRGHSRALAMLEYGVAQETGVVVITGEVGSGKTTLLRYLLNQLDDSYTVGMITNTHSSFGELIHWISSAFGLKHEGRDKVALYNQFVDFIISEYAAGRRVLVIVDEAQNMSAETLEELRVISNINADKDIVMQLVLVGQPELRDTLGTPELRQFVQRISAFYYLKPLEASELTLYIEHRLKKAGCDRQLFDHGAIYLIHEHSAGIPRIVNTLCNLGLTYAFGVQSERVTEEIMREVVEDRAEHGLFGIEHLSLGEDGLRKVTKKKTTRKKAAAKKTTAKKTAVKKATTKKATTKKATTKKATTKKATTKKATTKKATTKKTAATAGADNDNLRATAPAQQTDERANAEPNDNLTAEAPEGAGTENHDLFSEPRTDKAVGTITSQASSAAKKAVSVTEKSDIATGQTDSSRVQEEIALADPAADKDPAVVKAIVEASMFEANSESVRQPEHGAASEDDEEPEAAGQKPETSTDGVSSTEQSDSESAEAPEATLKAAADGPAEPASDEAEQVQREADEESAAAPKTDASAEKPKSPVLESDVNSIERLFGSATNRNDAVADTVDADAVAAKGSSPIEEGVPEVADSVAESVETKSADHAAAQDQDQHQSDTPADSKGLQAAGKAPESDRSSDSRATKDAGLDAILAAVEGVLADHERRDRGAAPPVPSEADSMPHKRPLAEAISDAVRTSARAASSGTGAGSKPSNVTGAGDTETANTADAAAAEPAKAAPAPRLVPRIEVNLNEEPDRPAGLMGRLRSFFNGS